MHFLKFLFKYIPVLSNDWYQDGEGRCTPIVFMVWWYESRVTSTVEYFKRVISRSFSSNYYISYYFILL